MGYDAIRAKRILQDKLSKLKLSFAGSTPKSSEIEKMEPANCNSRNGQLCAGRVLLQSPIMSRLMKQTAFLPQKS
jgi:hypothetical protein